MITPNTLLTKVQIDGFRSIKEATVELGPINVLIGPNGAGKSNLLSALRLPPLMRTQTLRQFVGEQGGASSLLHYGPSQTPQMTIALTFASDKGENTYEARLGYAARDSFIFLDERVLFAQSGKERPFVSSLGAGHTESLLAERAKEPTAQTTRVLERLISGMNFFHFHDTSPESKLRQNSHSADNRYLRSNGSNLPTILYRLKQSENPDFNASWQRIEGLVQSVAPYIRSLEPSPVTPEMPNSALRLYWQDARGHRFDSSDLSDGTLRAIALITALAQPAAMLPRFIAIDEPELGLHPAALSRIASLARSVSHYTQILVSTQSPALLDEFEPEQVIVVEQQDGQSNFARLNPTELDGWLAEYSLSELYDKNVLGGRP